MSAENDSVLALVEAIKRKAPAFLDLITATTSAEFETAFNSILERAVVQLESNKKNLEKLDEEGLSAVFAMALTIPGLTVSQETNSNGHVDLTIEATYCFPMRKKLGEAKIYDGPVYHEKGLQQLVTRYSTGRECRGLMIVYVRKANIADLVVKLRKHMDSKLPLLQQGATQDYTLKWSFLSTHKHSCGDDLQVSHILCNLHV
ncbi:MAG: hypothetical protein AMXMBFR45_01710 [Gammaproteobacteria bacterium]|nr:hypothetical protein [Gammaproteobacteria bacterium PRO2]GIK35877.1 MAG: hypothetical protein BroJett010_24360 [Gammaproteobacteria bacterium]